MIDSTVYKVGTYLINKQSKKLYVISSIVTHGAHKFYFLDNLSDLSKGDMAKNIPASARNLVDKFEVSTAAQTLYSTKSTKE